MARAEDREHGREHGEGLALQELLERAAALRPNEVRLRERLGADRRQARVPVSM